MPNKQKDDKMETVEEKSTDEQTAQSEGISSTALLESDKHNANMDEWWHDITDSGTLTKEKVDFAYDSAKSHIEFHVECAKSIEDTTNKIIGFTLIVVFALAGFTFSDLNEFNCLHFGSFISFLYMTFSLSKLIEKNFTPEPICAPTHEPKGMLSSNHFNENYNEMILSFTASMQEAVDYNRSRNKTRGVAIGDCVKRLTVTPVFFIGSIISWSASCYYHCGSIFL